MRRLLFVAAVLLLLAACGKDKQVSGVQISQIQPASASEATATAPTPPATTAPSSATMAPTVQPARQEPASQAPAPAAAAPAQNAANVSGRYRIRIPQIDIDAPIVPVGLESDGALAAPPGPNVMGVYSAGPAPGQKGNMLLTAHLDWRDRQTGVAAAALCWRCRELAVGAAITIQDGDKTYTYKVTKSVKVRYDDPEAQKMMYPSNDTILTLITCEGPGFDEKTRNYTYRRMLVAALQ